MSGRTFAEDLAAAAARDRGRAQLLTPDGVVSVGELDELATRVARSLVERGVQRGDRVVIVLPNGVDAAASIYGVLRAGAAFSPVNPTIKHEKLAALIVDLDARVVLCDAQRSEMVSAAAAAAGDVQVIADIAGLASSPETATPTALENDLAAVIYTSGSTGEAKGVTLSHRNMTFVADSIIEYLELVPEDRILCVLPLSFNYGLYQLLMCVRVGALLVLEPGFAFPGRVVGLLEDEGITGFPAVPTIYQTLLSLKGLRDRELPALRFITNAGAALPEATAKAVRATFPNARLFLMYGLTEATRVAFLPPELVDAKPTCVGNPIPGTEAWLEDEHGNRVGVGEVGELIVRGPHVMQGYWNNVEGSAVRLRPGRWAWDRVLATNDLFRYDEDGHLNFVGRRDDVIKSRGEKVAPREVEEVLCSIEGVREAAVIGVDDDVLGQAVIAHVARVDDADLQPTSVRRGCAEKLEDYKVPRKVFVHDALPRTGNGKVDRSALAEMSVEELSAQ